MTQLGHRLTGLGAGALASGVVLTATGNPVYAALAGLVSFSGATAPDWLEIPWAGLFGGRRSVIPHRTWTHWLLPWLVLALGSQFHPALAHTFVGSMLLSFCIGGLTHLALDIPNPMGIPIFNPKKRRSLRLWSSGKNEPVLIFLTWLIGFGTLLVAI